MMNAANALIDGTADPTQAIVTVPIGSMDIGWTDLLYTGLIMVAIIALLTWRHHRVQSRSAAEQERRLVKEFSKRNRRNIFGQRINWTEVNPHSYTISEQRIIELAESHGLRQVPPRPGSMSLKFMPAESVETERGER